jgi:hypothetical protein
LVGGQHVHDVTTNSRIWVVILGGLVLVLGWLAEIYGLLSSVMQDSLTDTQLPLVQEILVYQKFEG